MSDSITPGPLPIHIPASDGYRLAGWVWRHADASPGTPVAVINAATSVRSRYYSRFAAFLHGHGFHVVTYDYRGIGASHPGRLRGFEASWLSWGELDFEAVLQFVLQEFPGSPVNVVAHSIGGFVTGLAPSAHRLYRVCTVGSQIAYWRDFAPRQRARMVVQWQIAMPLLTACLGYFPGKRLGWLEDTPRGVVHDWSHRMRRYESLVRRGIGPDAIPGRRALVERCSRLAAPLLAIGIDDDAFGTAAAIERLLAYFGNSPATHLRLAPEAVGEAAIGHFAFFHNRFEHSLWRIPLQWLQSGSIPADIPSTLVRSPAPVPAPLPM